MSEPQLARRPGSAVADKSSAAVRIVSLHGRTTERTAVLEPAQWSDRPAAQQDKDVARTRLDYRNRAGEQCVII